jgi:hypothetical protein
MFRAYPFLLARAECICTRDGRETSECRWAGWANSSNSNERDVAETRSDDSDCAMKGEWADGDGRESE